MEYQNMTPYTIMMYMIVQQHGMIVLYDSTVSRSDILQNGSDWPNTYCEQQRHYGKCTAHAPCDQSCESQKTFIRTGLMEQPSWTRCVKHSKFQVFFSF